MDFYPSHAIDFGYVFQFNHSLITKKETAPYNSVVDFIYEKMTFGGIVDKTLVLKDGDLRMIKRLANDELKARRLQNKAK